MNPSLSTARGNDPGNPASVVIDSPIADYRRSIPLVAGVIAPFAGESCVAPFRQRRFIRIHARNFEQVLQSLRPSIRLVIRVIDDLVTTEVVFRDVADFDPRRAILQVAPLRHLHKRYENLISLRAILHPELERILDRHVEASESFLEDGYWRQEISRTIAKEALLGQNSQEREHAAEWISDYLDFGHPPGSVAAELDSRISEIEDVLCSAAEELRANLRFRELKASWLGLRALVEQAEEAGCDFQVRILPATRDELSRDLGSDPENTFLWKLTVSDEFERFGGTPYNLLLLDYSFGRKPEDVDFLRCVGTICSQSFTCILAGVDHDIFAVSRDVPALHQDLAKTAWLGRWRRLMDEPGAQFIVPILPRVCLEEEPGPGMYGRAIYTLAGSLLSGLMGKPEAPMIIEPNSFDPASIEVLNSLGIQTPGWWNVASTGPAGISARLQTLSARGQTLSDILAACRVVHGVRAIVREFAERFPSPQEFAVTLCNWSTWFLDRLQAGTESPRRFHPRFAFDDLRGLGSAKIRGSIRLPNINGELKIEFDCNTSRGWPME